MRPELALNDALINKSKRPDFKLAMDSGPTDESTGQSDEENNEGAGLPEKWIWSAGSVLIKKSLEKLDHAVKSDSPTDESTGQSDKENNENDDQPEKLESKLENAPAIRGEVETLVERHTSKIFKDKDKDRMTKFNKFAESTRRRRNFKRDDEDAHEIRYVDVIEVRNGRSRLLEPSEYLSKTKHDPNKNEEVLKSKGFTRKDTPVADSSFYYQVASFVKDFIFGRVFTVIDIIENVYDVQLTDSTSEGRTKSTVLKGRKAPVSTLENRSHVRDKGVIPIWQRCMRINGLETTLTPNDIESKDMLRWFDKFDSNKSGTIDFDEFSKALKSMGFHLHKREVKTLMERFDREGDGEIDYREFALWLDKTDTFVKRRTIAELLQIIKKIYTESLKDDPEFSDQELQLSPDRGVLTHFRGILKSGILTKLIRLRNEHASDKSDTHLIEIDVWNALLENELTVEELRRVARVFESRKQNLFNEYIKVKIITESQEDEPTPTPAPTPALIKHQYVSYAWIPPATKSSSHQTTASMPLLSLSDQSKEDEKASDPMKLSGTRKLARKSLEALGSVAGQVRQGVDVTEAFKKFPVTRRKNNTIVRFSDFSDSSELEPDGSELEVLEMRQRVAELEQQLQEREKLIETLERTHYPDIPPEKPLSERDFAGPPSSHQSENRLRDGAVPGTPKRKQPIVVLSDESVDASQARVVNLNQDPLFSECLVYYTPNGNVTAGSDESVSDILLSGPDILPKHCIFSNIDGLIFVQPVDDAKIFVNGDAVSSSNRVCLQNWDRISLGRFHLFRFEIGREDGSSYPLRVKSTSSASQSKSGQSAAPDWEFAQAELMAKNEAFLGMHSALSAFKAPRTGFAGISDDVPQHDNLVGAGSVSGGQDDLEVLLKGGSDAVNTGHLERPRPLFSSVNGGRSLLEKGASTATHSISSSSGVAYGNSGERRRSPLFTKKSNDLFKVDSNVASVLSTKGDIFDKKSLYRPIGGYKRPPMTQTTVPTGASAGVRTNDMSPTLLKLNKELQEREAERQQHGLSEKTHTNSSSGAVAADSVDGAGAPPSGAVATN